MNCPYSIEDFKCQIKKLFEIGPFWNNLLKNEGSIFNTLIEIFSKELYLINTYICQRNNQANPCSATTSIDDWIKIYQLDECDELLDACNFATEGNCEFITKVIEAQGFKVRSCKRKGNELIDLDNLKCLKKEDLNLCHYVIAANGYCNHTSFGSFDVPSKLIDTQNKECERNSKFLICEDCCEEDVDNQTNTEEEIKDETSLCDYVTNREVYKSVSTCERAMFFPNKKPLFLDHVSTLEIILEPICISPVEFGKNLGREFDNPNIRDPEPLDFLDMCLIEKFLPIDVSLDIKFADC